jgi:hypothetical protein
MKIKIKKLHPNAVIPRYTFPPKGDFLGYFDHGGINDFQHVCIRDDEDTDEAFATQAIFPHLTHWRPLPPPPVEKEVKE